MFTLIEVQHGKNADLFDRTSTQEVDYHGVEDGQKAKRIDS